MKITALSILLLLGFILPASSQVLLNKSDGTPIWVENISRSGIPAQARTTTLSGGGFIHVRAQESFYISTSTIFDVNLINAFLPNGGLSGLIGVDYTRYMFEQNKEKDIIVQMSDMAAHIPAPRKINAGFRFSAAPGYWKFAEKVPPLANAWSAAILGGGIELARSHYVHIIDKTYNSGCSRIYRAYFLLTYTPVVMQFYDDSIRPLDLERYNSTFKKSNAMGWRAGIEYKSFMGFGKRIAIGLTTYLIVEQNHYFAYGFGDGLYYRTFDRRYLSLNPVDSNHQYRDLTFMLGFGYSFMHIPESERPKQYEKGY